MSRNKRSPNQHLTPNTQHPAHETHNLQPFAPMLVLVAVWAVMEILIDPRGNFPLNDDWWYARSLGCLLNEHKLIFPYGVTMTLVSQLVWGVLFCKIFGASFHVLRASTLVLGLVGILATYGLLREIRVPRSLSFIGAMVIAVNPWYVELSNTFMTDVPFFAFAMLSLFFYVRAIRRDSVAYMAAGTLLACIAVLTRQIGIMLPISFAVAYLVKNGIRPRSLINTLLPVIVVVGLLLAYQKWLSAAGRMPLYYSVQSKAGLQFLTSGPKQMLLGLTGVLKTALVYTGLFLFPVLIATLPRKDTPSPRLWRINLAASTLLGLALLATLILHGEWMPLKLQWGNILIDFGVGPATLCDVYPLKLSYLPTASKALWQLITVVGVAGAALLFRHLLQAIETIFAKKADHDSRPLLVLWLSAAALCLGPVILLSKFGYFDRYFLILLPLLMPIALLNTNPSKNRALIGAALAVIVLFGVFGVGATHDYFAWNRARWKAYGQLAGQGRIPSTLIQGGYECNGWLSYEDRPNWERKIDPQYALTFGPIRGYHEIARYPFRRWMPPGEGHILIMRRSGGRPKTQKP